MGTPVGVGAHTSRAVRGPGVHECRAGYRTMSNTKDTRKWEHDKGCTKYKTRRRPGKTAMSAPGTTVRGLDRACEGSEQCSTLGRSKLT